MSVRCDHSFKMVDALLKRNWFADIRDVHRLIHELPDDVLEEVLEHRNEYSESIRWALSEPDIPRKCIRNPVRDISGKEWENMVLEKEKERMGFIKEHKKAFVAPPRPFDELDEQIQETQYKLKKLKEELEELVGSSKKTKKYMPPGMRGKQEADDPMTRLARMDIALVENELTGLLSQLEASNKRWTELAWLDAALLDAAKRPSFLIGARAHTPSA